MSHPVVEDFDGGSLVDDFFLFSGIFASVVKLLRGGDGGEILVYEDDRGGGEMGG